MHRYTSRKVSDALSHRLQKSYYHSHKSNNAINNNVLYDGVLNETMQRWRPPVGGGS